MKTSKQDAQYQFFLELPPTDYLKDIEIQDEYEKTSDSTLRGLSEEQVSQIAVDSLKEANLPQPSQGLKNNHPANRKLT